MYEKLIIFYFTGTGNALAAAKWIAEVFVKQNITVDIVKITPSSTISSSQFASKTLIGFCYPTHGFNAPPIVVDFLLQFPNAQNHFFLLNTRAGMKFSKFFTPGLSGLAQLLPLSILSFKGYKIIGLQPLDLPSNWISIHPGLKQKVVDSIFNRCEQKTKQFAIDIISGKKVWKGLLSLPLDLIISPISLGYYFYGRMAFSKTYVADSSCNGCGICKKECPVHAIKMIDNRPFWTRKCESCMHCMNRCPQRAIQTPHLFVMLVWWFVWWFVTSFLLKQLVEEFPEVSVYSDLVFYAILLITGLPVVFFTYRILHFLMKYNFFNWLVLSTSLTKWKFWRRYREGISR